MQIAALVLYTRIHEYLPAISCFCSDSIICLTYLVRYLKIMDLLPELNSTFWKTGRIKTYQYWPFQSSDNMCNPDRMARAGFFTIGGKEEPDLVECFVCSKQLDGWDPDDDPWSEHQKHESKCAFISLGKTDENLWTVNDLFHLLKKYTVKECTRELDKAVAVAKGESTRLVHEIPEICKGLRKNYKDQRY